MELEKGIEVIGIISLRNKSGKLIKSQKIKSYQILIPSPSKKSKKENIPFSYLKHGTVEIEIISKIIYTFHFQQ